MISDAGDAGAPRSSPYRSGRRRVARWILLAVGLAAIGLLVRHAADLRLFVALARQARPAWLLLALLFQIFTYVAVAAAWRLVLRRAGAPQPLRRLLPIAVSKLFADQALPGAGLGGHVLLVDRLLMLGTPRSTAVAALLISMLGYYLAYAALAIVMLLVLHDRATALMAGLVSALLLVALAVPALALWLRHRGKRPLSPLLERLGPLPRILRILGEAPASLVGDRGLITRVSILNGCVFLADAATMTACLLALGLPFAPATAFLALMAGSIAATLAPIPLGLGSFEVSATAMMHSLGVPLEAALTATLLLRGMTLWLPLLPGLVLMRGTGRP